MYVFSNTVIDTLKIIKLRKCPWIILLWLTKFINYHKNSIDITKQVFKMTDTCTLRHMYIETHVH